MVIDAHARIGESFDRRHGKLEEYIGLMEQNRIDRALLCPQKPLSYRVEDGNDTVERAMSDYAHLFWGAARLDPWKGDQAIRELELRLKTPGFVAAYLNPWEDSFRCNDEAVLPMYAALEQKNVPLVLEAGYPWVSHISQIGELALLYPRLRILATNAGQLDLSGLTFGNVGYLLGRCPNLFIGTASCSGSAWLKDMAENVSPGRVVFETGYPRCEPWTEKRRIELLPVFPEIKKEIFSSDLLRFLFGA
ncbi:amidohydrolase family protein [Papillibacter cinnamivorans]|uniref:Predicted metal-dependent hydrolase, TIM-barrel fold n=1 Tax=Papillibacter cinnamivorans DSM 12816 TaxID=1122930 RepID=A0A1W2CVW3_9FIRM|nr:amidohydrolase family protein [Papillibacter cinnamivorans]SMC88848.1 Predicted metal-dependent hydrolase, TIM-barrel fold [Papillibacter cinnamivorans DSM 12816]